MCPTSPGQTVNHVQALNYNSVSVEGLLHDSLVKPYRNLHEHIHLHPFPHPNQQEDLLISRAMPL